MQPRFSRSRERLRSDLTIAISGERALAGSSSTESHYIPSDLVARAHFEQEAGTRWPRAKIARGVFETDFARNDRSRAIAGDPRD